MAAAVIVAALWAPSAAATKAESTHRVSRSTAGAQPNENSFAGSVSSTGRFVVFSSEATNLVPGDTNHASDVFVRDRMTGTTTRISLSSAGAQANGACDQPTISANGRYVAFTSAASNLVAGDTNTRQDVFVRDRLAHTTERVSVAAGGVEANGPSGNPHISADGQFVAYTSDATNLVANDTNAVQDAFLWSQATASTTRVSVSSAGVQADKTTWNVYVSGNGRIVAFTSSATNLVPNDTNATMDAFQWVRRTGKVRRIDRAPLRGGQVGMGAVVGGISADGSCVLLVSASPHLVRSDVNRHPDVFVWVRSRELTLLVSRAWNGAEQDGNVYAAGISSHGRYVVFVSDATNLTRQGTNGGQMVFLRDRTGRTTVLVSRSASGLPANGPSARPQVADGARWVLFDSQATNLVPGDTNGRQDVFMRGPLT